MPEALAELGQEPEFPWPERDAASVARWARQALPPIVDSPFESPRGTADHGLLSAVLLRAKGGDHTTLASMMRAATDNPHAVE